MEAKDEVENDVEDRKDKYEHRNDKEDDAKAEDGEE